MKFLLAGIILTFLTSQASAEIDNNSTNLSGDLVIANIMVDNVSAIDALLLEKSSKTLHKVSIDGDNVEFQKSYLAVYGSNEGDKQNQGDNKTPLGVYYITSFMSESLLKNRYGAYSINYGTGAYPLNYPNPVDIINKKTGGGIWVHGGYVANVKETTQGCVSLHNDDVSELKKDLRVKHPVVITQNLIYSTPEEYQNDKEKLLATLNKFISSWRDNDVETFKSLIHGGYRASSDKTAKAYIAKKSLLMSLYKYKVITTGNTKIYRNDEKNLVFDTNQFYCAPNLTTYGNKRYYFSDEEGELKLISEEFFSLDSYPYVNKEVQSFIDGWSNSWRSLNIGEYITYYSENFKNKSMDKGEWFNYKKRLFENSNDVEIGISKIRWDGRNNRYKVSFTQDYKSKLVSDKGIKTLTLEGCPGDFKIIAEDWVQN